MKFNTPVHLNSEHIDYKDRAKFSRSKKWHKCQDKNSQFFCGIICGLNSGRLLVTTKITFLPYIFILQRIGGPGGPMEVIE